MQPDLFTLDDPNFRLLLFDLAVLAFVAYVFIVPRVVARWLKRLQR